MWFFKKNIYKKFKRIIFVDGENVGMHNYQLRKNDKLYYFVNQSANINIQMYQNILNDKRFEFILLNSNVLGRPNAMDFCIVAELTKVLDKTNLSQELLIISKDKGYDSVITYLKQQYPDRRINRQESLEEIVIETITQNVKKIKKEPTVITEDALENAAKSFLDTVNQMNLETKIRTCSKMSQLRKILTSEEYEKAFMIHKFPKAYISYNCYLMTYKIWKYNELTCSYMSVTEGKNYKKIIKKFNKEFKNEGYKIEKENAYV